MQTELVGPELPRHSRMPGKLGRKDLEIPDVIHAFFKLADKTGGQTDPTDTESTQLAGDIDVLGNGSGVGGLVHRDFELKTPIPEPLPE